MEKKIYDCIIIGAGLSGLATAHFLKQANPEIDLLIIDKAGQAGGTIASHAEDGFLAEWGAHGFLDNVDESRELLEDLNLGEEVQKASLKSFERYLCLDGKLKVVPQSPLKILKSDIMTFGEKLRVLGDLFKRPKGEEQTVADWVAHRFGKAMMPFADAVFTGTYAGDIEKLSIDAAMPGVRRLELEKGSVIRGAIQMMRGLKKKKKSRGLPSMVSFKKGMGFLLESLAKDKEILYDTPVVSLRPVDGLWQVHAPKSQYCCRHVVLAVPINRALSVLRPFKNPPVKSVPEARLCNVVLGFDEGAEVPFGFGYLAPEKEGRFAMGTLFSTHMFPGRAPEGKTLVEVLVGGRRHPEHLELDDEALIDKAYADIKELIPLPEKPVYSRVLRPESGIPQLETGHLELLKWRDWIEKENPGISVFGFGWEGIGINDMIKKAKAVAWKIRTGEIDKEGPEARAVYV